MGRVRQHVRSRGWAGWIALVALVALFTTGCATVIRSSVVSDGSQGDSNSSAYSVPTPISDDGRYVAFTSWASNLVPGDTNGAGDVFRHDNRTGETVRVSVTGPGGQVEGESTVWAMSGDGRVVAFATQFPLDGGDTNTVLDLYVRDVLAGTTERVSIRPNGDPVVLPSTDGSLGNVSVSDDGRYVMMVYRQYMTGEGFVRDRQTGISTLVTQGAMFAQLTGDGSAFVEDDGCITLACDRYTIIRHWVDGTTETVGDGDDPQTGSQCGFQTFDISSDGRYLLGYQYAEWPNNYCSGLTGLLRWDTVTRTAVLIGDGTSGPMRSMSDDGRLVQYVVSGGSELRVVDTATGVVQRVDTDAFGVGADMGMVSARLSDDGRFTVFATGATNLVPGDTNWAVDVFTRFTIRPTVGSATPGSLSRGSLSQVVQVRGSFLAGSVPTMGEGVTVEETTQLAPDLLEVHVSVAPDAPTGPHDVWVTNVGAVGTASGVCPGCLTIT